MIHICTDKTQDKQINTYILTYSQADCIVTSMTLFRKSAITVKKTS